MQAERGQHIRLGDPVAALEVGDRLGHPHDPVVPARAERPEAPGGELYVVTEVKTRAEAEAAVAVAGPGARVFAIRPAWSLPAREWIASDPEFWRARHP